MGRLRSMATACETEVARLSGGRCGAGYSVGEDSRNGAATSRRQDGDGPAAQQEQTRGTGEPQASRLTRVG